MDYSVGKTGKIIVARLYEGEELHQCIEQIAIKEDIKAASVLITGGFRSANIVVGPKQETPKIVPDARQFQGPGEVLGVGTLYWAQGKPKMHMHSAIAKGDDCFAGCIRDDTKVFLILEVTIIEILGINAERIQDPKTGLNLLSLGQ